MKKIAIGSICSCGINCKCSQMQDSSEYVDKIDNLGYDPMVDFIEK